MRSWRSTSDVSRAWLRWRAETNAGREHLQQIGQAAERRKGREARIFQEMMKSSSIVMNEELRACCSAREIVVWL